MSTPTKRRKTDAYKGPQQPIGSLDSFFAKARHANSNGANEKGDGPGSKVADQLQTDQQGRAEKGRQVTDEELARQLQEEWDKEGDGRVGKSTADPVITSSTTIPNEPQESKPNRFGAIASVADIKAGSRQSDSGPNRVSASQIKTLSLQSTAQTEDTISFSVPFDENPLTFDPQKYLPALKKYWAVLGNQASYGILTRCFVLVNSTQSRIKIVDTLVNFLRTLIEGNPDSLLPAVC